MKERFLELLSNIDREGMDELIKFLEKSDFFKAPASTKFHGDYEGGLLEHSLKVYDILCNKVKTLDIDYSVNEDTLKIVANCSKELFPFLISSKNACSGINIFAASLFAAISSLELSGLRKKETSLNSCFSFVCNI